MAEQSKESRHDLTRLVPDRDQRWYVASVLDRSGRAKRQPQCRGGLGRPDGWQAVDCISERSKMHIVDDWTILYRDRSIVYVQKPRGGCHGLWNGMSLIRDQFGTTRMCEGDINQIVDLRTGFGTGACVYSKFVPYRKVS
jgi:hypothetical protein